MEFERARTKEQKEVRVEQIITAATRIYESVPYERISMSAIAGELDFSRANLYKYFSTKEEIFLKVLERDFMGWAADIEEYLTGMDPMPLEEFAQVWTRILLRHSRMLERFSLLTYVVKRNVSVDRMAEFFRMLQASTLGAHAVVSRHFPSLSYNQLELFLKMQIMFAIGMHPFSSPSTIFEKAIARAQVPYELPEFTAMFSSFIRFTINGLLAESEPESN